MEKQSRHKNSGQFSFLGEEKRLDKIDSLGDTLLSLHDRINWEQFRSLLSGAFPIPTNVGGRPSYDYVLMLKVIILQRYTGLSDHQMEFQINDRHSYRRFLDISSGDDVPDTNTIWNFREAIRKNNLVRPLFRLFQKELKRGGLIGTRGRMVDASFVDVPRQRNSRDENLQIKNGETPEDWKGNLNKIAQKDTDARWTIKNKEKHFGYKNHVKADAKSKLIMDYVTTSANVHDSQTIGDLISKKEDRGQKLYADSAYIGGAITKLIAKVCMISMICKKGFRSHPLTRAQEHQNRKKSRIRVRVEHIFGFQENSMSASMIRTIGIERADAMIGLNNLTYNMFRFLQIT